MKTDTPHENILYIRIRNLDQCDEQRYKAVSILADRAQRHGCRGILVTRHSPKDFIAQLRPDIPYGTIQERREW